MPFSNRGRTNAALQYACGEMVVRGRLSDYEMNESFNELRITVKRGVTVVISKTDLAWNYVTWRKNIEVFESN